MQEDDTIQRRNAVFGASSVPGTGEAKYKGVKGWLLLLCVGLTILTPIRALVTIGQGYSQSSPHFDRFPGLRVLMIIDIPLSLALVALSVHAGVSLWSIRPRAVQITRRFFYLMLGYLAISCVLPFTAGLPSEANSAMAAEVAKGVIQGLITAAIWLSYLTKSKRVRATYPDSA